jgi:hypothetical protein
MEAKAVAMARSYVGCPVDLVSLGPLTCSSDESVIIPAFTFIILPSNFIVRNNGITGAQQHQGRTERHEDPNLSLDMKKAEWLTPMETILEVLNEGVVIADYRHRILL